MSESRDFNPAASGSRTKPLARQWRLLRPYVTDLNAVHLEMDAPG
jgi:hypothetical protein